MFNFFKTKIRNLIDRGEARFLYNLNRSVFLSDYSKQSPSPFCFSNYCLNNSFQSQEIIVSLTTHSERIRYIHLVLDSLYCQTLRPDFVHLYLSRGEYTSLPSVLKKFQPWLKIYTTEEIGAFKKFIPALLTAKKDQLIISLDDDFLYPPSLIYELYNLYVQCGQRGVCRGLFAFNGLDWGDDCENFGVGGGMGILWDPKIFNQRDFPYFFDQVEFLNKFKNQDDAWIAHCCMKAGIHIYALCHDDYNYVQFPPDFITLPSAKYRPISFKHS